MVGCPDPVQFVRYEKHLRIIISNYYFQLLSVCFHSRRAATIGGSSMICCGVCIFSGFAPASILSLFLPSPHIYCPLSLLLLPPHSLYSIECDDMREVRPPYLISFVLASIL